jgi:aminoglycoside phosphotransferase (APT) family kinase protein
MKRIDIPLPIVCALIAEQFPKWSGLPIRKVDCNGWDNQTFHLGSDMLIRLPSAESYAAQVLKEQKWLPKLAAHLSVPIPEPLAKGRPSKVYPWDWSVYRWLEGESANALSIESLDLNTLSIQLAQFLKELQNIGSSEGPPPGAHNCYRGAHPSVYDSEIRSAARNLSDRVDEKVVTAIWEEALSSDWGHSPVWIHGDFSAGNILIQEGRLSAVIDFGCMGVGDPACDLVIAWTLLDVGSRSVFRSHLNLDPKTWARARGWALWKALITLQSSLEDQKIAEEQKRVVQQILRDPYFE